MMTRCLMGENVRKEAAADRSTVGGWRMGAMERTVSCPICGDVTATKVSTAVLIRQVCESINCDFPFRLCGWARKRANKDIPRGRQDVLNLLEKGQQGCGSQITILVLTRG